MRAVLLLASIHIVGCGAKEREESGSQSAPAPAPPVAQTQSPGAKASPRPQGPAADQSAPAAPTADQPAPAAAERPLHYDRAITESDLQGRTLRELSLLRNTIFARAGHPFRKKWLRDYFEAQPWYEALPAQDKSKIGPVDRQNVRLIAEAEANVKKTDLEAAAARLQPRIDADTATSEEQIEIRLISTRLGKWVGSSKVAARDKSPLEDPTVLDRLISLEQLQNLSRRDLRILRNTVFARRGYEFKSAMLEEYFYSAVWYEPDPGFSEEAFSAVDRKNIRLIRSVEDSLGGPLSDRAHQKMVGWLSAA